MTVRCEVHGDATALVATLTGRLRPTDTETLRDDLYKCLAEQPGALLIDLRELHVEQPLGLAVFTDVLRQAACWPGTPVRLCGPSPQTRTMLQRDAYHRLPIFDDVPAALRHLTDDRASLPSISEELLPVSGSTRHARNVATEACLLWDLPDLVAPASLIVTELVGNVIDHAHTMMRLRLSLRSRHLNLAVWDGSAQRPVLRPPNGLDSPGGRGLLLVNTVAHAWGHLPSTQGKVIWAALRR